MARAKASSPSLKEWTVTEKILFLQATENNFYFFFKHIFSESLRQIDGEFIDGPHFRKWCYELQSHLYTSKKSARFHGKSVLLYAWIMWLMWKQEIPYEDGIYFSFTLDMAQDHLKKCNRYIEANPFFSKEFTKLSNADSIVHYKRRGAGVFYFEPAGIKTFKRGKHPRHIVCDDILRDPEVKLDITQIQKITVTFKEQIIPMPKKGGTIHLMGTPQDQEDLFAELERRPEFYSTSNPAILNEALKLVLWPEYWTFERLMEFKDTMGEKAFNKEFACLPSRSADGYFQTAEYDGWIKSRLKNYDFYTMSKPKFNDEWCYAGMDLGKKAHPSHLAIFATRHGSLYQVHSKFMDGWNYIDQLEYVRDAIKYFKVARLDFDNTRAEFEGFYEAGELPEEMQGLVFNGKNKFTMAAEFDKLVAQKRIYLLNDDRQRRQILSVDNDLNAIATKDGHGDAFFSVCLAIRAAVFGQGIAVLDNPTGD